MNAYIRKLNSFLAVTRVLISLGIAAVAFVSATLLHIELLTNVALAWDCFCMVMITLSWITFFHVPQKELCQQAQKQDESRSIIFIMVLLSVCISLVGIVVLMKNADESLIRKEAHRTVSLLGVALSWVLLHTVFTLRYAHLYYYEDDSTDADVHVCGLDFPKDETPDYLDFAYFAFVVGMTFQVSDVQVTTKKIRRVVLLHGLLSFVFNTTIVALTISIVSNLGK